MAVPQGEPLSANVATIEQLFLTREFIPAAVQRDFQWEEKNVKELLADLD